MNNIEKLQLKLEENDAVIIYDEYNRFYFSTFNCSNGLIVVMRNKAVFFTDFRYIIEAKAVVKGAEVRLFSGSHFESIKSVLDKTNVKRIFFEDTLMSYDYAKTLMNNFPSYEFCSVGDMLRLIRAVKSDEEIEYIKKSQAITDKGFTHIVEFIKDNYKKGITEKQVALELEFYLRNNGSGKMPFDIICASGINSACPHAVPSDKMLEAGDFVTIDFGSSYMGYASDMTRTIAIDHVTEKQEMIYNLVATAQAEAKKAIRTGVVSSEVDKVARDYFKANGFDKEFGHSLGHSVGVYIHEFPNFSPSCSLPALENSVLSVEPGLYIEGEFGVRIEDLIVVKNDGYEDLTNSPKNLIILQ